MATEVERKVFFYRVRLEEEGQPRRSRAAAFDAEATCRAILRLGLATGERYLDIGNDIELVAYPNVPGKGYPRLVFGTKRHSGLPELEKSGKFSPLEVETGQGLIEKTHVMFFENNIVGAEFNFYGPRLTRLPKYIIEKCPEIEFISFDPLIHRDTLEELEHLSDIRLIQLRLHRDYFDLLKSAAPNLPESLSAWEKDMDAPVVGISLRSESYSRAGMGRKALDFVRALAGRSRAQDGMQVFRVRGKDDRTGKVEWFDLLEDRFVSVVKVAKEGRSHRAIDSRSMFSQIEAAHSELKHLLVEARSLSP